MFLVSYEGILHGLVPKYKRKWDLANIVPYSPRRNSDFRAENPHLGHMSLAVPDSLDLISSCRSAMECQEAPPWRGLDCFVYISVP